MKKIKKYSKCLLELESILISETDSFIQRYYKKDKAEDDWTSIMRSLRETLHISQLATNLKELQKLQALSFVDRLTEEED